MFASIESCFCNLDVFFLEHVFICVKSRDSLQICLKAAKGPRAYPDAIDFDKHVCNSQSHNQFASYMLVENLVLTPSIKILLLKDGICSLLKTICRKVLKRSIESLIF